MHLKISGIGAASDRLHGSASGGRGARAESAGNSILSERQRGLGGGDAHRAPDPALFLLTGISARMGALAARVGRRWLPAVMVYALLFVLAYALLTLPLAYYQDFVREHAYGLSNQSLGKWLGDWVKGVIVGGVGLTLVLWIPYLLLRRSPRRWWLYAGLATLPISTFVLIVTPVWVDPLFNDFGRMNAGRSKLGFWHWRNAPVYRVAESMRSERVWTPRR